MISEQMIDLMVESMHEILSEYNNKAENIKQIIDNNPSLISDLEKILKEGGEDIFDDCESFSKLIYRLKDFERL